jgi:hypothetical protein
MRTVISGDEFRVPEPVLMPVNVANYSVQDESSDDRLPVTMVAVLEPDALPGLDDAFTRNHSGDALDVVSQWRVALPHELGEAPVILLYLRFPEHDVQFNIRFDLDEHKRSLSVAARTGRVELWEPALSQALLTQPPDEAFAAHRSIGLTVGDAEPLRRALQHRFDLPLVEAREPQLVVPPGNERAALEAFQMDAGTPQRLDLITTRDAVVVVIVVDADAEAVSGEAVQVDEEDRWANWAMLRAGPYILVRLDVLVENRRLRSWLIADPPQELVRAASAGPHGIVVLSRPLPTDMDDARRLLAETPTFVVHQAPEAMRSLLR